MKSNILDQTQNVDRLEALEHFKVDVRTRITPLSVLTLHQEKRDI